MQITTTFRIFDLFALWIGQLLSTWYHTSAPTTHGCANASFIVPRVPDDAQLTGLMIIDQYRNNKMSQKLSARREIKSDLINKLTTTILFQTRQNPARIIKGALVRHAPWKFRLKVRSRSVDCEPDEILRGSVVSKSIKRSFSLSNWRKCSVLFRSVPFLEHYCHLSFTFQFLLNWVNTPYIFTSKIY